MEEVWTESFDDSFNKIIPEIKWLPWVGNGYSNSSKKLLIIGESQYNYGANSVNDGVIYFIDDNGIKKDSGSEQILIRNITKAVIGKQVTTEEKQNFWKSISYHVMVQRILETIKERPTGNDYVNGWNIFFQVIKTLKPNFCIFCGVEAANYNGAFVEYGNKNNFSVDYITTGTSVGNVKSRKAKVTDSLGQSTTILFIKHPSQYFNWKKWSLVINEEMNEHRKWLTEQNSS